MATETKYDLVIPEVKRGRSSKIQQLKYKCELSTFAEKLIEIQKGLPNKVSSRGWCYLMENFNLITKSQFDMIQKLINKCRKKGILPIRFVEEDSNRSFDHVEDIDMKGYKDPFEFIESQLEFDSVFVDYKDDITFWESQGYYLQMLCEKKDVFNLFNPICKKYHIAIANGKGWPDLICRANLAERYIQAEKKGLKCVLLYYGDFDPIGNQIGSLYKKMLNDVKLGTKFDPKDLIVDHFGLTYEFIQENNLIWIDNLESGSGKKPDKSKAIYRDYIAKYGERKVEANIIIVPGIRELAEKHLENTILKYLGSDPFSEFDKKMTQERGKINRILSKIGFYEKIKQLQKYLIDLKENDPEFATE